MLLPLIAIVIPLIRIMPPIYKWRVRRRAYRWYKALRKLERKIQEGVRDEDMTRYAGELDRIESEVKKVKIPLAYAEELYQLRLHIRYIRESLERPAAASGTASGGSETSKSQPVTDDALEDAS